MINIVIYVLFTHELEFLNEVRIDFLTVIVINISLFEYAVCLMD